MGQVFNLYMFSIGNKRCMMFLIINLLAFKHLGLVPNATGASGAEGVVLLLNCDLFEKQNCCLFQVFLDQSMFIFCVLIFNFHVENLGCRASFTCSTPGLWGTERCESTPLEELPGTGMSPLGTRPSPDPRWWQIWGPLPELCSSPYYKKPACRR